MRFRSITGRVRMESASMRKNLRRLGWIVVPVLAVGLAACRNYDVEVRAVQPAATARGRAQPRPARASPRPDRPLPTTLEVEFPLQPTGGGGNDAATQRTATATTQPHVPPATGPAIGTAGERVVRMPLRELIQRAVANNLEVKVAGYTPAIEQTRVVEAEARFDPTFFTNVQYSQENVLGPSATNVGGPGRTDHLPHLQRADRAAAGPGERRAGRVSLRAGPHRARPGARPISAADIDQPQPVLDQRDHLAGDTAAAPRLRRRRQPRRASSSTATTSASACSSTAPSSSSNIFELERAYWQLVQAMRDVNIAENLLDRTLDTGRIIWERSRHEAGRQQLSQANSSIETRRTILIRARARVRDLSDQIKRLMNDPEFPVASNILIVPADDPLERGSAVQRAGPDQHGAGEPLRSWGSSSFASTTPASPPTWPRTTSCRSSTWSAPSASRGWAGTTRNRSKSSGSSTRSTTRSACSSKSRSATARPVRSGNAAQLQRLQAIDQYRALVDEVALNVRTALRQVQTTWDEIYGSRRARLASADALSAIEEREKADAQGLTPEFVNRKLDLQAELAQNESREAEAMSNYMIAISDLERGQGDAAALQQHHHGRSGAGRE